MEADLPLGVGSLHGRHGGHDRQEQRGQPQMVRHEPAAEGREERGQDELKGAPCRMHYSNGRLTPYHRGGTIQMTPSPPPSSISERLVAVEVRQIYTDRRLDLMEAELRQRKTSSFERLKWAAAWLLIMSALGVQAVPQIAINIAATLGGR